MDNKLKKTVFVLCCMASSLLYAQSQYEVVVKSAFSPVIQDAQKKINFPAKITDTVQSRQTVDYDVRVRPLQPHFTPEPIVAPKVGKDQIDRLYHHYLKAGVGYLQPFLEYDFSTLRSKSRAFGLHLLSHSSFDQVRYSGPSSFTNNHLNFYGQQFAQNFIFEEQLGYGFDLYHCYGYPADSLEAAYNWTQTAQQIARYYHQASAGMKAYTRYGKSLKLNQMYTGNYDFLYDNYHSFEHRARASALLDKRLMTSRIDYFKLGGQLNAEYLHDKWDTSGVLEDIWQFGINPHAQITEGLWQIRMGLQFSTALQNGDFHWGLFPDVRISYDIVPNVLSFYTGAVGEIRYLSYAELSRENPFLAPQLEQDFDHIYHFYVATKTNLSHALSFGARVSVTNYSAMPYFLPDTTPVKMNDTLSLALKNTFLINQARVLSTDIHIDLSYRYKEVLQCALNFDYNSYSTADTVTIYYKPHYIFSLDMNYSLKRKISVGTQFVLKADAYYPEFVAGGVDKEPLATWFDWSVKMEYKWSRRLRFFADLNNLIGRSNQMYDFYYSERFNCLFGVKYIFGGE
ncbi:MAG: hypothetical protein J5792_07530 [Bacteroidales bacterium]|nr:hypothetical protein [Bacteroidales bacterium]